MDLLITFIFLVLPVLINVAFVTLLERKILGLAQLRLGPNKVGPSGLVQPFADAVKLFIKQLEVNRNANIKRFIYSPAVLLIIILLLWVVVFNLGLPSKLVARVILFILILRLGVYPVLLRGWSSNSKYAILGGIRAVAQTISYEVRLAIMFMLFIVLFNSLSFHESVNNHPLMALAPLICVLWLIMCVAETNRTPFDFAEGERELVSGFNIEYASIGFVLIFLSEYGMIIIFSSLCATICFSVSLFTFLGSVSSVAISSLWISLRATYPRYRYDMLIGIAWKRFLPISLGSLVYIVRLIL